MKDKKILLGLWVGIWLVVCCQPVLALTDIKSHWARLQIDHLHSRDLISGYPDGSYHPDAYVTREEFVTLLVKAIHKENEAQQLSKGESTFADAAGRWSMGYIELARELGIAQGSESGLFLPGSYISREEAVTMLVNCLKADHRDLNPADLADSGRISPWAQGTVAYARQKGIISGYPDGSFRPQANITRAEVACILEEMLGLQGERHHFYGTLQDINLRLRQMIVRLNGVEQTFEMAANVLVYARGEREPVKELELPLPAYFDLNANGKLSFVYINDTPAHGKVNLDIRTLPDYARPADYQPINIYSLQDEEDMTLVNQLQNDPANSLKISRDAMKGGEFMQLTGASGRGQLVAVIDSGIDSGHPDLQYTQDNFKKVIDFVDLTNEGQVALNQTAWAVNGSIRIGERDIKVDNLSSVNGEFRYGYFETWRLPLNPAVAYPDGQILVVASKSRYIDRFDTVYMDLNGDGQLNAEQGLKKYSETYQLGQIKGSGNQVFNFVVAEMARDGSYVKLGYDALGHGTMVAGVVAADGIIAGVAPNAQLLPVKIINSAGTARLDNLKLALRLSAERGAKIAVVSMGQMVLNETERQSLADMAAKIWQDFGMAICIATGNDGPGIGTAAATSALNNVISVGAYATPEMWQNDFGWQVNEPRLWYFSPGGPGRNGRASPLVVAPGSAVSTYPLWADSPYQLDQGSSMAAPHVAGAAALLMDAVSHQLYRDDVRAVWMALLGGAEPLKGYQPAEQGYGAINLLRSWQEIKNLTQNPLNYELSQYSPEFGAGSGFYSRTLPPGKLSLTIKNPNYVNSRLAVGSLSPWIMPGQMVVQIPANSERTIDLDFAELKEPGLYSGFVLADNALTPGWDAAALQTVIVPYKLAELPERQFVEQYGLAAGEYKRYFFEVPPGSTQLSLALQAGQKGRVRMHLVAPDGSQTTSHYAGVGDLQPRDKANLVFANPLPGTWEVVVYSSLTLSSLGLENSIYTLTASLEADTLKPWGRAYKYLVSALPEPFKAGEKSLLSLHFYNASSKMPVNDLVYINGRLYEVKDGRVQLEITPPSDVLNLNIAY